MNPKDTQNETLKKPQRNPHERLEILIRNPDKKPWKETPNEALNETLNETLKKPYMKP